MVVFDDHLGGPGLAPMEQWKTMEDLVAELAAKDLLPLLPRGEEAVLSEIERRAGKTLPCKVIRPIGAYRGFADVEGLQDASDALAGLEAIIRDEITRRARGEARGTGR